MRSLASPPIDDAIAELMDEPARQRVFFALFIGE
jgi:hypothetical protein